MSSKITSAPKKVRNHVVRNRTKYGFVAGFVVSTIIHHKVDRVGQWNAFLEEKGLTAEFYLPE